MQSRTSTEWIKKVNEWIKELAKLKSPGIDWSNPEEQLSPSESFTDVEKLKSVNSRNQPQRYKSITLYHYFINLC
ncbi:MAG: hypothetical protein Q8S01_08365 [Ignavibacteria bacterium]|nr:hypothetical protein [Ignavibacteria bacterium]